ncbi:MAG: penicillin-binding protein 1C [Bacteroidota bacterium]
MKDLLYNRKKLAVFLTGLIALLAFWLCLPSPLFRDPYSLVITDRDGDLLQARIATDGQWRFPVDDTIPAKFEQALLAFEDKHFYYHPGVDLLAIGRATVQNIRDKKVVSGGSTLSMQTVRIAGKRPRTLWNKLLEMVLAVRLECGYSKREILSLYAAHAPFGGNVVGLNAASWRYFGRDAATLSWAEAACLAVLPNSPALIHPGRNRGLLYKKRNRLLQKMVAEGIIDQTTCDLAQSEPLPDKPIPLPQEAPHLLARILAENEKIRNTEIRTTVSLKLQQNVAEILERHHHTLKNNQINNAAAIVLEVKSGNVLAYVGNIFHPEESDIDPHVDVIAAPRSPGSTLKPLLYAASLQDGLILPTSLLPDIPTQISGYSPQNFDLGYDGAVHANRALARSLNVPAVKLLQQYKTERFHHLLKKMGVSTLTHPSRHYGLSLILGGGENTLWELSGIYSSMARTLNNYPKYSGRYFPGDWHMPNIYQDKKPPVPVEHQELPNAVFLGAGAIYSTFESMNELMRPGEEMLWTQFNSAQKIAWKTGTSFGFRDGWAIGVSPKYVVAVWVGNADGEGRPGLTGISAAAPILFDVFKLLPYSPWFEQPYDDMVRIPVCPKSGYRAGDHCPVTDSTWVPAPGLQAASCPYHQLIHLDPTGTLRVTSDCCAPSEMRHDSWFVLPPSMEWYYRQCNADYKPLPGYKPGCETSTVAAMEMIYPRKANKIYVPVELDGKTGSAIFEVAHREPSSLIFWHIDDQYVGSTKAFHHIAIRPEPGKHILVVTDESGERLEQPFEVLGKE